MTRKDYDVEHLVRLLQGLKGRYPHLQIILEPGSAFTWQTGVLSSEIVDIVENRGIRTAILNVSFTCHMPDCSETPAQPAVRGAEMGDAGLPVGKEDYYKGIIDLVRMKAIIWDEESLVPSFMRKKFLQIWLMMLRNGVIS